MRNVIAVLGPKCYGDPLNKLGHIVTGSKYLIKHPNKISLVVFTGGEDVHPSFYGKEDTRNACATNIKRDKYEKKIFDYCQKEGIKTTGICRGFQFLNVMAGGMMYQHINDHGLSGLHFIHFPYLTFLSGFFSVTSTHHQLVYLPDNAIPIAWATPKRSNIYLHPDGEILKRIDQKEIEAAIFPNINAVGVQYHPEMMFHSQKGRAHYEQMMADFIKMEMDEFRKAYSQKAKVAIAQEIFDDN